MTSVFAMSESSIESIDRQLLSKVLRPAAAPPLASPASNSRSTVLIQTCWSAWAIVGRASTRAFKRDVTKPRASSDRRTIVRRVMS